MYFLNIKVLYILYILSFQYNNNFYFKCMGNRTEAPKKKINMELPKDPVNLLLGIYPN